MSISNVHLFSEDDKKKSALISCIKNKELDPLIHKLFLKHADTYCLNTITLKRGNNIIAKNIHPNQCSAQPNLLYLPNKALLYYKDIEDLNLNGNELIVSIRPESATLFEYNSKYRVLVYDCDDWNHYRIAYYGSSLKEARESTISAVKHYYEEKIYNTIRHNSLLSTSIENLDLILDFGTLPDKNYNKEKDYIEVDALFNIQIVKHEPLNKKK